MPLSPQPPEPRYANPTPRLHLILRKEHAGDDSPARPSLLDGAVVPHGDAGREEGDGAEKAGDDELGVVGVVLAVVPALLGLNVGEDGGEDWWGE